MTPSCSVIVTSYNQKKTLELLLESLERQTRKDFEVVIADDGSSDGSDQLCTTRKNLQIQFVSQPDDGYRKARIVNEAIRRSQADYLIFLDSDVILEKNFVKDHLNLSKPGYFVCGRRVDLGPRFSSGLSVENIRRGDFDGFNWALLKSWFQKDSSDFNRSVRVTPQWIRKIFRYDRPVDILGSNFSAWKADVISVNGFNEAFESYWGEDGDLYVRLRNSGKFPIGAKAICIQFHVFHERRSPTKENVDRHYRLLNDQTYKWAERGINSGNQIQR